MFPSNSFGNNTTTRPFGQQQPPMNFGGVGTNWTLGNPWTSTLGLPKPVIGPASMANVTSLLDQQNTKTMRRSSPPWPLKSASSEGLGFGQQKSAINLHSTLGSTNIVIGSGDVNAKATGVEGTTGIKYCPLGGTDVVIKQGLHHDVKVIFRAITCMKQYDDKSFEELRCKDYEYLRELTQQSKPEIKASTPATPSLLMSPSTGFGKPNFGFGQPTANIFSGFGGNATTAPQSQPFKSAPALSDSFGFASSQPSLNFYRVTTASPTAPTSYQPSSFGHTSSRAPGYQLPPLGFQGFQAQPQPFLGQNFLDLNPSLQLPKPELSVTPPLPQTYQPLTTVMTAQPSPISLTTHCCCCKGHDLPPAIASVGHCQADLDEYRQIVENIYDPFPSYPFLKDMKPKMRNEPSSDIIDRMKAAFKLEPLPQPTLPAASTQTVHKPRRMISLSIMDDVISNDAGIPGERVMKRLIIRKPPKLTKVPMDTLKPATVPIEHFWPAWSTEVVIQTTEFGMEEDVEVLDEQKQLDNVDAGDQNEDSYVAVANAALADFGGNVELFSEEVAKLFPDVTDDTSEPPEEDTLESSNDQGCGIKQTRPDYYITPSLTEISQLKTPDGACVVTGFTIGKPNCGCIFFPDPMDVANLNLDELVNISYRKIEVYPDDANKPPVGEGLNRRARLTIENVWPSDEETHEMIKDPQTLAETSFETRLRKISAKQNSKFLSYSPDNGAWVFEVEHF